MTRDNVTPLNCYQSRFGTCGKHVAIQTRAICEYSELAERSQFMSSVIPRRRVRREFACSQSLLTVAGLRPHNSRGAQYP
jgi:hypothetical protein